MMRRPRPPQDIQSQPRRRSAPRPRPPRMVAIATIPHRDSNVCTPTWLPGAVLLPLQGLFDQVFWIDYNEWPRDHTRRRPAALGLALEADRVRTGRRGSGGWADHVARGGSLGRRGIRRPGRCRPGRLGRGQRAARARDTRSFEHAAGDRDVFHPSGCGADECHRQWMVTPHRPGDGGGGRRCRRGESGGAGQRLGSARGPATVPGPGRGRPATRPDGTGRGGRVPRDRGRSAGTLTWASRRGPGARAGRARRGDDRVLGYLYGARSLYAIDPRYAMAVHTAVGLVVLSTGLLAIVPGGLLHRIVTHSASDPGYPLLRRLLPMVLVVLPLVGWLRLQGERRGWYGSTFGAAIMTIVGAALVCVTTWWAACLADRCARLPHHPWCRLGETNAALETLISQRTLELADAQARVRGLLGSVAQPRRAPPGRTHRAGQPEGRGDSGVPRRRVGR